MKTISKNLYRPFVTVILALLVLAIALPFGTASASPLAQTIPPKSDDFNRCSYDNTVWTLENPANAALATPKMAGTYGGDSHLTFGVPSGQAYTFSGTNQDAPRLMQRISDNDFEVEVKFMAPIRSETADWKMMGILVRDSSQSGQTKWYRFDVNSSNGVLNMYMGYLDPDGDLNHIQNVADLPGGNPTTGPIIIRVKYEKLSSAWTVTYLIGNETPAVYPFNEAAFGGPFVVTDIGFFVGNTGSSAPEHIARVDYFRNLGASFEDDPVVLTVLRTGSGSGNVNWPMTSSAQCQGTSITLTATPDSGSYFAGWSGAVTSTNSMVTIPMNTSKTVTATFNTGQPAVQQFFIPIIQK